MTEESQGRLRALVLFVAPVVLLVGFIYHPYVDNETDTAMVAEEVVADPERWAWAHLIVLLGLGLTLLAVFSVRQMLRAIGEKRWSFIAVPLLVVGGTLNSAPVGAEITLAGVANAGADVEAVAEDADPWITPVFFVGAVLFALGWLSFAGALYQSQLLERRQTWIAIAALVVLVIGMFILATGGAYLVGVAALVVSWLIGYRAWTTAGQTALPGGRPAPA